MTTISASSTIGVVLTSPSYANPVVINPGVTISSSGEGVSAITGGWTIQNFGSIAGLGTSGVGVVLFAGGSVTNESSASISGYTGIFGNAVTVTNAGSIAGTGSEGFGVLLSSGGSVTNTASASITGNSRGVYLKTGSSSGVGIVVNNGAIAGSSVAGVALYGNEGVALYSGSSVTNAASASIMGGYQGVAVGDGVGTVVNDGSIVGSTGLGIIFFFGGSVTNAASASITGGFAGVFAEDRSGAAAGTVVNDGSIAGTDTSSGDGVDLASGGYVTNAAAASISGGNDGVFINGAGTVVNDGGIAGNTTSGVGVLLFAGGGSVTNQSSASISGNTGIYGNGGALTIVNAGSIFASGTSGDGIDLMDGGLITNAASGTIASALYRGIAVTGGSGTLVNAGTISGTGGNAVQTDAGFANRVVVDPGADFVGKVNGGNIIGSPVVSTLELASGTSAGTLSGLGTQFVDFAQTTIDANAFWTLTGANTIAAGATLTEFGGAGLIDSNALENDGAIVLDPSTLTVAGLTGTGSVTIEAGSMLEVQDAIAGGETLAFGGSGAHLHLGTPGSVSGTVTNFDFGETIDLKGVDPTSVNYVGDVLSFSGGSFALSLASVGVVTASASEDGADVTLRCFCANTLIQTPLGERPVQELAVGDLIWTVLGESEAPIIWTGRREVDCARHPQPRKVWPVRVAAGAFGPGRPHGDLFLSPDHAIYVSEVLIPVKHLINGSTIMQVPVARVTYHHLELAEHDVLLAEGLPAESFLDMRDGSNYANRPGPIRLYPDFSVRMWEAFGCARLIVAGTELNAARALVGRFAAQQVAA